MGAQFNWKALLCLVPAAFILLVGCDPETTLDNYFKKQGLNRLAYARDDIEPGGLVLVGGFGAVYADSMLDYVTGPSDTECPIWSQDGTSEYNAVLKSFAQDRTIEPNAALGFIEAVVPISFEGKLKLTDKVSITMTKALVRRMKVPTIQRFLNRSESGDFRTFLDAQLARPGTEAFVIYETLRTNQLKMTAESGKNITSGVEVGKPVSLVSNAKGSFSYVRTSNSAIELTGDHFYVFAVRAGRLEKTAQGTYAFVPGGFKFSGALGGTEEEKYTQPLLPEYRTVSLRRVQELPPAERPF